MTNPALHLDILSAAQRRLWDELVDVPGSFVLYGGTAIALHLRHRRSVDFDLFGTERFDPDVLYRTLPFLSGSLVVQKSPDTLNCVVERGGNVQISFFGVPEIKPIEAPLIAPGNGLHVAALIDLAGMKAAVVQKRAEAKDYIDIDALIGRGSIGLPLALAAGKRIYGQGFNPEITLKALSFFEDGDLGSVPNAIRDRLADAVRAVDLDRLPLLASGAMSRDPGCRR